MVKTKAEKNIEVLHGDTKIALRKLAIPTMGSLFILMLYNIVDSIWVAGLGANALAAIGFISPLYYIVINIGRGIGTGANSLIARSIGMRDKSLADNAAAHSLLLTGIFSIIIPIIFIPFFEFLLPILGSTSYATTLAIDYGTVLFLFSIVFILSGVLQALFRSEGDVKRAMYVSLISVILNLILDPIFIYTFNWGVAGAAWATVLSASISCIVMAYWLFKKRDTYLTITYQRFKYSTGILKEICLVAVPNMLEGLAFSVMITIINKMLTLTAGTTGVAVYTTVARLNQFCAIPLMGISSSVVTLAGEAFGERNYNKLENIHHYSNKLSHICAIIIFFIVFFGADYITLIFTYSNQSTSLAPLIVNALRIFSFSFLLMPAGLMDGMMFQGMGKGIISLIITVLRTLIIEIIFAYLIGITLGFGESGIYVGMVLATGIGSLIAYVWFSIYIKKLKRNEFNSILNS